MNPTEEQWMRENVPPERWQEYREAYAKTLDGALDAFGEACWEFGRVFVAALPRWLTGRKDGAA